MYRILLFLGWFSLIGSIVNASIALYAGYIVNQIGWANWPITVDTLFRDYIGWLYWVKSLAFTVLPDQIASWIFGLPALVFFPLRATIGTFVGNWILGMGRRMKRAQQ